MPWRAFHFPHHETRRRGTLETREALRRKRPRATGISGHGGGMSCGRRAWQYERRKRTRQLIEFGGQVVKAGIVDGDDRGMIYGALLAKAIRAR